MGAGFQQLLKQQQFRHSVNRPRHCTDNSHMEWKMLFKTKCELQILNEFRNGIEEVRHESKIRNLKNR